MPGPRPQPTKLKLVRGNPGRRKAKKEPQPPVQAPSPPDWLSSGALAEWERLIPSLAGVGMLTVVDGNALALYCETLAEYTEALKDISGKRFVYDGDGNMRRHPGQKVINDARTALIRMSQEFGLTPSARVRLAKPDDDGKKDDFDSFVRGAS